MTLNPNQFSEQQLPLDWEGIERENRRDAVRGHTVRILSPDSHPYDSPQRKAYLDGPRVIGPIHKDVIHEALETSHIPTNLISKLSGPIETQGELENGSGSFNGEDNLIYVGGLDVGTPGQIQDTVLHELGHRLDYTQNGSKSGSRFVDTKYAKEDQWFRKYRHRSVDSRTEGFADGFMEFHSGVPDPDHLGGYGQRSTINLRNPDNYLDPKYRFSKPGDYDSFRHGVSKKFKRDHVMDHKYHWNEGEQLIYHATRAHATATGERIPVDQRLPHEEHSDVDAGEHLHKLVSLSPHVEPALRHLGLWNITKKHMYKWKANQPKVTQLSFEGDNNAISRYIPVTHMSSQFDDDAPKD